MAWIAAGGAVLGGLLASQGGKKGSSSTSSTANQNLPPWLQGYTFPNLDQATNLRNDLSGQSKRSPSTATSGYISKADFDPNAYLAANEDVAKNDFYGTDPYAHYLKFGMGEGRQGYKLGDIAPGDAPGGQLSSDAMAQYLKMVNGDYLNPSSNPYLDATYNHAAGILGSGIDSRFSKAGRYGSGAHQGVLQEGLGNLANDIFGGNYQSERARQVAAIGGAPGFLQSNAAAAFAPYTLFNNLLPRAANTTGTEQSPYYTNPLSGAIGGGILGAQFAKQYGGGASTTGIDMNTAGAGDLMTAMQFMG